MPQSIFSKPLHKPVVPKVVLEVAEQQELVVPRLEPLAAQEPKVVRQAISTSISYAIIHSSSN